MTQISQITIIGAGMMGHGIAQAFLTRAGYHVAIYDTIDAMLETVPQRIQANLNSLGQPPCDFSRLKLTNKLPEALAAAQIVFEAAPEKLELKQQIFQQLEAAAPAGCILASNTSVIPITAIGARLKSRKHLVGTHWWNPPYLIPLVEVVPTADTNPAVVTATMGLLKDIGKVPVHVKKDVPGFVGNRLQHALWREAVALVEKGVCDAETVDLVIKNSFGLRLPVLGPLENADLVGIDLTQDIHNVILPNLDTPSAPSPLLASMISEGKLGMKSGTGFYTWTKESSAQLRERLLTHLVGLLTRLKASA
jgi:3-hydroxybutyryl-CoA dehydrogenase